jgi:hypothetical protein
MSVYANPTPKWKSLESRQNFKSKEAISRYIYLFLKVALGYTRYRLSAKSLLNLRVGRLLRRRRYTFLLLSYSLPGKSLRKFAGCQQVDHRYIKYREGLNNI